MKTFHLYRHIDVSNVSGTDVVAEGLVFTDGTVALRWLGDMATTTTYSCIEHVRAIHGHGNLTEIRPSYAEPLELASEHR